MGFSYSRTNNEHSSGGIDDGSKFAAKGPKKDIDEIVRLHNIWVKANRTGSIPMMRDAFVGGDKFFGWNLNGFAYDGIEEWATLWEWLGQVESERDAGRG